MNNEFSWQVFWVLIVLIIGTTVCAGMHIYNLRVNSLIENGYEREMFLGSQCPQWVKIN